MLSCGTKGLVHRGSQVIAYLSFDVTYYIEVKKFQRLQHCIVGGNTPHKNQFWTLQADLKRRQR